MAEQRLYTVRDSEGTLKAQLPETAARDIFTVCDGMWQTFQDGIRGYVLFQDVRVHPFASLPVIIFLWAGDVLIYPIE